MIGNVIFLKEFFGIKLSFVLVISKWEYDICKIKDREYFVVDILGVNGLKNYLIDVFK